MAKGIQYLVEAVKATRPRGGFEPDVLEVLTAIGAHIAAEMPEGYGDGFYARLHVALAGGQTAKAGKAAKSPKARAKAARKPAKADRTERAETVTKRAQSTVAAGAVRVRGKAGRCPACGRGGGFGQVWCGTCDEPTRLVR